MVVGNIILSSSCGKKLFFDEGDEKWAKVFVTNGTSIFLGHNSIYRMLKNLNDCFSVLSAKGQKRTPDEGPWESIWILGDPYSFAYARREKDQIKIEFRDGEQKIIGHLYLNERDFHEWRQTINEKLEKIKEM